jgi:class 3 adenylate cyclase
MPEPPKGPTVERRVVSVLFADLVGFTSLSEKLDPEDVAAIQDAYFATVRATVERYGGVLEKFIGDAAMAVFGVPRARDDDAERAVRAGLALINAVNELGARIGLTDHVLQLRVGVNSGEVAHAVDGPDAGRVTGDTVNLAARLQTAAGPGSVLLGSLTAMLVEEAIDLGPVVRFDMKGKAEPVQAREARQVRLDPSRDEMLGSLRAPTLGRDAELAELLNRALASASAGSSSRTLMVAPPGVGKSRLLGELARQVDAAGHRVLRARVRPHALAPYEAVAQLLAGALEAARGTPSDLEGSLRAALASAGTGAARAGVVVAEALGVLEPGQADAPTVEGAGLADEREARFSAWTEGLDALAHAAPVVWLVEDVHWAGGDLLAFLEHAGRAPTLAGRMVVTTARPSILDAAADWCFSAEMLDLPALQASDAEDLVRALVGDALPATLVASVAQRSDGNPLFIEELVRTWISVGTLVRDGDRWRLAVDLDHVSLPLSVQAIYAAQLDDLPADARMVARRASVAGRRFAVAAMEPLELEGQSDGLASLRRRGFVAGPQRDALSGEVYAYRHALLRDAGYASLARAERSRLHVALARWLEAGAGDRVDQLAESIGAHYVAALESLPAFASDDALGRDGLQAAAADWLERGAEASLRMAAHEAGLRLLEHSIELTPAAASLDLARRRLRLGEVMAESADLQRGSEELAAALEMYRSAVDAPEARQGLARAAHALGSAQMQQIEFHRAEELTRTALDQLGAAQGGANAADDAAVARLTALHAWARAALGDRDGVGNEVMQAVALVRRAGDPVAELDVLVRRALVRGELGDIPDGLAEEDEWREIEEMARRLGRWSQVCNAMRLRAGSMATDSPQAAIPLAEQAREMAETHGLTEQGGWCDLMLAECRFVAGDWDRALVDCERAISLAERYEYVRLGYRTWMVVLPMAAVRRERRLADHFAVWWERSRHHLPPTASTYGAVLREAGRLWTDEARDHPSDPVPEELVAATEQVFGNPHFLAALETIARAWLRTGRRDLAANVRDHASAALDQGETALLRCSASLLAAWVALANEDRSAAANGARRAISEARAVDAAWWLVRAVRALETAGAAEPPLLAEAAALEKRLGIAPVSG